MRIVVFSSNIPPLRNPRAFRMGVHLPILNTLSAVLVISSPNNIVGINEQYFVRRHGLSVHEYSGMRSSLKSKAWVRFFHRFIFPDDKIFHQIFYFFNYWFRYRKKDDLILTVSNPFSGHIIGWVLHTFFGHHWMVDVGDVYSEPHDHNGLYARIKVKFESLILNSCEHIIVNADAVKDYFLERHSLSREKISLIENGVHLNFSNCRRSAHETKNLVFIGNSYPKTREALEELGVLLRMAEQYPELNIRILLYGQQHQAVHQVAKASNGLLKISICHSDGELLEAYGRADFLVNFANKDNPGLPSKLAEYISCGLPIIHFKHHSEDVAENYLAKHKANFISCLLESDDDICLLKFLEKKHELIRGSQIDGEAIRIKWQQVLRKWIAVKSH